MPYDAFGPVGRIFVGTLAPSALILLWAAPRAEAAPYSVKAGGGGDYDTIGACAAAAVPGDTCVIYAGTYDETVAPVNSGTAGSPIVYSTNPGDSVMVTGWNLGTLGYVTIEGSAAMPMTITQSITWSAIDHSVFQYIRNTGGAGGAPCFGGNGWYMSGRPSNYNQFSNVTLQYCGGMSNNSSGAIELEGDYNLFDTIDVSYSQAAVTLSGQFNVVRNSKFGPTSTAVIGSNHSQPIESSVACGGSGSDIPGGLQHLLYENNYSAQWRGGNSHGVALLTDTGSVTCGTTTNVFRFSQAMDSGSYSTEIYSSLNTYFYNDSFSNTQLDNTPKDQEDYQYYPSAPNSRTVNNIFSNMTRAGSTDWCIYAVAPLVENHNLCFNTGWSGSWYGPTTDSSNSYDPSDIFNIDPLFVNADTDLGLRPGSPAANAGGPLTTTTTAGTSSMSLPVADAGFFSWGYGIPNVQADWIRIGASATVQIASIDYASNVIRLASSMSWASDAPVYLYKNSNGAVVLNGANPDIGASPFEAAGGSQGDGGAVGGGGDGGKSEGGGGAGGGPDVDGGPHLGADASAPGADAGSPSASAAPGNGGGGGCGCQVAALSPTTRYSRSSAAIALGFALFGAAVRRRRDGHPV